MADDVATPEQVKQFAGWTPQQWIDHAWGAFPDKTPASERARFAWGYLQSLRRPGEFAKGQEFGITGIPTVPGADKFVNLAYAEHYMYARYVVAETGDVNGEELMTGGYEVRKVAAFILKSQKDLKIGKYQPTPPSVDAVQWGVKGAEEGLKDYQQVHGKVTVPIGPAIKKDTELVAKEMKLTPEQKKQLDDALQKAIDVQGKLQEFQRMLDILKAIPKSFRPKDPSGACLSCSDKSESKVETSVSGKVLNAGGAGGGGSGTAV